MKNYDCQHRQYAIEVHNQKRYFPSMLQTREGYIFSTPSTSIGDLTTISQDETRQIIEVALSVSNI